VTAQKDEFTNFHFVSICDNQNSSNQASNFCLQAVLFFPLMFYINKLSEYINSCNHYKSVS